MGRLSKRQLDYHNRALKMLESGSLTHEDREYIFHNFQEGAKQMQGYAGAFFTPLPLAYEMTMEMGGGRIIDLAKHGVFILPQQSTPFRYSDHPFFEQQEDNEKYQKFKKQTGLEMEFNCGIDTTFAQKDWHDVSPTVEIVCFDFSNGRNLERPRNHKQNAPVQLAFNLV